MKLLNAQFRRFAEVLHRCGWPSGAVPIRTLVTHQDLATKWQTWADVSKLAKADHTPKRGGVVGDQCIMFEQHC